MKRLRKLVRNQLRQKRHNPMENTSQNPINELPNQLKDYINVKIDLISLFVVKKLSKMIPLFVLAFILAFTFLFFTLFMSHAFINWYEDYIGKASTAALIVSGFYLLLGLIFFIFRKALIYRPIQKSIIDDLSFKDINSNSEIDKISSIEDMENELSKLKTRSEKTEEELSDAFDDIKYFYSFDAIKSRFFTNILENPKPAIGAILQSIMTVQNFRTKRKKKREKNTN